MDNHDVLEEDVCQRCGDVDEDCRTLWHSCRYDMAETGLPLRELTVKGAIHEKTGTKEITLFPGHRPLLVSTYADEPTSKMDLIFYNLRVCKRCRSEWIMSIANWFHCEPGTIVDRAAADKVEPGMIEVDGMIPVRVMGATICVPRTHKRATEDDGA